MAMGLFLMIQWRWVVQLGQTVNHLGDVPGMIRPGIKDGNSCDLGFNGSWWLMNIINGENLDFPENILEHNYELNKD